MDRFFGDLPKQFVGLLFARVFGDAKDTGQYADDVAIENGGGLVKGDAADGAGGVAADARQGQDIVKTLGELSAMLFKDDLGGFLEVSGAGVISKTFPEFVDFVRMGGGGSFDGGQFAHPMFPKGHDGFDLGLLEHDFGDIYTVRITAI